MLTQEHLIIAPYIIAPNRGIALRTQIRAEMALLSH